MCLAIPGKISEISGLDLDKTGLVLFGGISKEISLCLVPEAQIGDYVLVHAGFAITIVNDSEAQKTLTELEFVSGIKNETSS